MMFPILTHDVYAIASLITLILGSFFVANHLHERWFSKLKLQLIDANLIVKLLIVLMGGFIISWRALLNATLKMQLLGIILGIAIGFIYLAIERYLVSLFPSNLNVGQLNSKKNSINNLLKKSNKVINKVAQQSSYLPNILVGSLEEILYRGYLTILLLNLLNPKLAMIGLIFVTFVFALSHLNLGAIHVLAKGILGTICLLSFIFTKTIITPMLIHATFNALVINKYKKLGYV